MAWSKSIFLSYFILNMNYSSMIVDDNQALAVTSFPISSLSIDCAMLTTGHVQDIVQCFPMSNAVHSRITKTEYWSWTTLLQIHLWYGQYMSLHIFWIYTWLVSLCIILCSYCIVSTLHTSNISQLAAINITLQSNYHQEAINVRQEERHGLKYLGIRSNHGSCHTTSTVYKGRSCCKPWY